ncbi:hypothetical protein DM611_10985 [Stenotrophomonas maltophilia]|nr:hypothetical protein DM611_10985 [Stenotrophomonas maltophilia]MBA0361250.1 hypothetical protein [Stenotrophomonas maltophilia]MBA0429974.1 hypothetical protein [Stenotrophomonas maltophilia]PZP60300.1 MAG: hypothetical protein DI597_12255 [Pseudoxanthomonas spadix]
MVAAAVQRPAASGFEVEYRGCINRGELRVAAQDIRAGFAEQEAVTLLQVLQLLAALGGDPAFPALDGTELDALPVGKTQ